MSRVTLKLRATGSDSTHLRFLKTMCDCFCIWCDPLVSRPYHLFQHGLCRYDTKSIMGAFEPQEIKPFISAMPLLGELLLGTVATAGLLSPLNTERVS
jgi:hypothetical protein